MIDVVARCCLRMRANKATLREPESLCEAFAICRSTEYSVRPSVGRLPLSRLEMTVMVVMVPLLLPATLSCYLRAAGARMGTRRGAGNMLSDKRRSNELPAVGWLLWY